MKTWIDLRCDSSIYRQGSRGQCRKLLLRYAAETQDATLQVKCARCGKTKEYNVRSAQAISLGS